MIKHEKLRSSRWYLPTTTFSVCLIILSGCSNTFDKLMPVQKTETQITSEKQAKELKTVRRALSAVKTASITSKTPNNVNQQITVVKTISAPTMSAPTISAVGYASIASQPGKNLNQRRLMAIRAARMDAMRTLTEQIHGITIKSETQLSENILQSETLRASVDGVVRGARTIKIEPKGRDTYAVTLEIDRATITQLLKSKRFW